MQYEKRIAQAIQMFWRQRATRRHRIQEIASRDRRHAEHPFHHRPIAALLQAAIQCAGDRHHIAVNARGGGLVQFQFPLAEMRPRFQGAEIQEP